LGAAKGKPPSQEGGNHQRSGDGWDQHPSQPPNSRRRCEAIPPKTQAGGPDAIDLLTNSRVRRQKTIQPVVEPLFRSVPLGVIAGDHRVVEPFEAPLKIAAGGTSQGVCGNCLFHYFAGLAIGQRGKCGDFGTGYGAEPRPQQGRDLLQKAVFTPAGHFQTTFHS
jgi:hypothetical protein